MAPSLALDPDCDFAHGVLRAIVLRIWRHYEPEGLLTLCGSNCEIAVLRRVVHLQHVY